MLHEDELIADLTDVLEELATDGSIELVTKNGPSALAAELALVLEHEPDVDLEEWLLDRDEVVEVFIDRAALRGRLQRVLQRLEHGDPPAKWNDALAAAITADPEDVNARLVFGDWLQQEGDPRGELIAVQSQRSSIRARDGEPPARSPRSLSPLERREKSLLERFRTHFFGGLTHGEHGFEVVWRYGFFEEARVDGHQLDVLLGAVSSRFLRRLVVPTSIARASELLIAGEAAPPPTLRELQLGIAAAPLEDGAVRIEADGDLESLEVACAHVSVGALRLPKLQTLSIRARELVLPEVGELRVPSVTDLAIAADDVDDVRLLAIVEALPPKVVRLRISTGSYGDWLEALLRSDALARLELLDLRGNALTQEHIELFLEHAPALAHLVKLDLRGNYLYEHGRLEGLCREVLLGHDPDRSYEYEEEEGDEDEDGENDDTLAWDNPTDLPNEDHFEGEEEEEQPDDEIDEADERGVDQGPPVEERERIDEDAVD